MTLAIGMHCEDGLILAADTRMSYERGPISEGRKLDDFTSHSGTYVIAQTSYDAHAADTLISEIRAKLEANDPKSFLEVESAVKGAMAKWYVPAHKDRGVQLLVGVCLNGETSPALYFCEPPGTASRVWEPVKR